MLSKTLKKLRRFLLGGGVGGCVNVLGKTECNMARHGRKCDRFQNSLRLQRHSHWSPLAYGGAGQGGQESDPCSSESLADTLKIAETTLSVVETKALSLLSTPKRTHCSIFDYNADFRMTKGKT